LKTNATTYSSETDSQVYEVSDQLTALTPQSFAVDERLGKLSTQMPEQRTRLIELDTQLNIPSTTDLDALKDQWCDRSTQFYALIANWMSLSAQKSRLRNRVSSYITTGSQNVDLSVVNHDSPQVNQHFSQKAKTTISNWRARIFHEGTRGIWASTSGSSVLARACIATITILTTTKNYARFEAIISRTPISGG
jgi:hypothetical protein